MKTYRVGVVGAGNVTTMHLDGLKAHPERVEVAAICDPNEENLLKRADQYEIPQRFGTLEAFIQKSGIDAAIVCTPSSIRKEVLFPLIEAGIPVFVEKPVSETLQEAIEISEKSAEYGVPVSINQNFRTFFTFDMVKRQVQDGQIGAVTNIVLNDMYFRQDNGWRLERERHALSVMGIHWFDGFRWILGCEAQTINCQTRSSSAIDCTGDTDSSVQLVFENDVPVTYVQSFSSAYNRVELIVVGETGTLVANYKTVELYRKGNNGPIQTWNNLISKPESTFDGLQQLLLSIESKQEAANSIQDNLKTISLLEAAYRSSKQRAIVTLQQGIL